VEIIPNGIRLLTPYKAPPSGNLTIAIDLTGVKVYGEGEWEKEIRYHRRSLSETAMFRYKVTFGRSHYLRKIENQKRENELLCLLFNLAFYRSFQRMLRSSSENR
jgi:hypothetical protein